MSSESSNHIATSLQTNTFVHESPMLSKQTIKTKLIKYTNLLTSPPSQAIMLPHPYKQTLLFTSPPCWANKQSNKIDQTYIFVDKSPELSKHVIMSSQTNTQSCLQIHRVKQSCCHVLTNKQTYFLSSQTNKQTILLPSAPSWTIMLPCSHKQTNKQTILFTSPPSWAIMLSRPH
jgi:hypothetical protein